LNGCPARESLDTGPRPTMAPMPDTTGTERGEADSDHLTSILAAVTGLRDQVDDMVEVVQEHVARMRADRGVQVIEYRTAAEFEQVPEIGWWLAQRLVDAQPIHSFDDLYGIDGIGFTRASNVWDHFCGSR